MGRTSTRGYERRSAAQWERLIAEQSAGALSQRVFCARRGIAYSSFCGWKRRLGEAARGATEAPAFIELAVEPPGEPHWDVELTLGTGVVVRVRRR
jgi:hypothetical protein